MSGFSFKFPPWFNYILLSAALTMLYLITERGWDFLVSPLLFLLGLSATAFGADAVINRRTDSSGGGIASLVRSRSYFGIAAVAYGFSALLLGAILVAGAVLRQLNVWDEVWASLQANPGWLMGIVGIFLFLGSLIGLVDQAGQERGAWQKISALPRRILAVLGIMLAAVLIAAGLLEIFYRSGFDALLGMLQDLFLTSFDG
jgi:formate-dependent nitrite reductase membrane component NrfD